MYSNDGPVEVIREFFSDRLIVVKTKAGLGLARYIGMRSVDTKWFAFIDSDVVYIPRCCYPLIPVAKRLGRRVVVHLHDYQPVSYSFIVFSERTRSGLMP
ncbi:MAG: glycosyltransferase [Thermofilaceae archaeon]